MDANAIDAVIPFDSLSRAFLVDFSLEQNADMSLHESASANWRAGSILKIIGKGYVLMTTSDGTAVRPALQPWRAWPSRAEADGYTIAGHGLCLRPHIVLQGRLFLRPVRTTVLVNGTVVVEGAVHNGALPGKVLRHDSTGTVA